MSCLFFRKMHPTWSEVWENAHVITLRDISLEWGRKKEIGPGIRKGMCVGERGREREEREREKLFLLLAYGSFRGEAALIWGFRVLQREGSSIIAGPPHSTNNPPPVKASLASAQIPLFEVTSSSSSSGPPIGRRRQSFRCKGFYTQRTSFSPPISLLDKQKCTHAAVT